MQEEIQRSNSAVYRMARQFSAVGHEELSPPHMRSGRSKSPKGLEGSAEEDDVQRWESELLEASAMELTLPPLDAPPERQMNMVRQTGAVIEETEEEKPGLLPELRSTRSLIEHEGDAQDPNKVLIDQDQDQGVRDAQDPNKVLIDQETLDDLKESLTRAEQEILRTETESTDLHTKFEESEVRVLALEAALASMRRENIETIKSKEEALRAAMEADFRLAELMESSEWNRRRGNLSPLSPPGAKPSSVGTQTLSYRLETGDGLNNNGIHFDEFGMHDMFHGIGVKEQLTLAEGLEYDRDSLMAAHKEDSQL